MVTKTPKEIQNELQARQYEEDFPIGMKRVAKTVAFDSAGDGTGAVSATAATQTLTSTGTAPANNDTVTVDTTVYTAKTTLTEVRATGTLTSDATAPSDGDTVTIGNKTYTFKTALTPTEGEVLIGASAAIALDNLKSAINHTGTPDTDYSCAAAHTQVRATTNTDTTQVIEALVAGTAGNAYATTEAGTHTSFGAATLEGGVDAVANEVLIGGSAAAFLDNLKLAINGTAVTEFAEEYSTGTVAHTTCNATTNTDTTQIVAADDTGTAGNAIAVAESSAQLSWGDTTLNGGSAGSPITLFTVTGDVLAQVFSIASEDVAGAGTLEVGLANGTALLVAQVADATNIDNLETVKDATPALAESVPDPFIIGGGQDIILTLGTANLTNGTMKFYCLFRPLSDDGDVVAA